MTAVEKIREQAEPVQFQKDFPDLPIDNPYLQSLPQEAQERILTLAGSVLPILEDWAAGHNALRVVRARPVALTMAAAAPMMDSARLAAIGKLNLWVFGIDDHLDEGLIPDEEVEDRIIHYRGIAHNQVYPDRQDDLAVALFELIDDLASRGIFSDYRYLWADALSGTMNSMLQEKKWAATYQAKGAAGLPSLKSYLAHGRYSVGGPPHIWATMLVTGDPSLGARLPELGRRELLASTCIRLANDLRSNSKEAAEGKINSILIEQWEGQQAGHSPDDWQAWAIDQIRIKIASGLNQLNQLNESGCTATGVPEQTIHNVAHFVCDFYSQYDFHTFEEVVLDSWVDLSGD